MCSRVNTVKIKKPECVNIHGSEPNSDRHYTKRPLFLLSLCKIYLTKKKLAKQNRPRAH